MQTVKKKKSYTKTSVKLLEQINLKKRIQNCSCHNNLIHLLIPHPTPPPCAIPILLYNFLHISVITCRMCEELHELLSYCFIFIIYQIIKYLVIISNFRGFYVVLLFCGWFLGFWGVFVQVFFHYLKHPMIHLNFLGYFGTQNDSSTVEVNFIKVTFLISFYTASFNGFLFYTRIQHIPQ